MNNRNDETRVIKTIEEFEKIYLPNRHKKKKKKEKRKDPKEFGRSLAKELIKKFREDLKKALG